MLPGFDLESFRLKSAQTLRQAFRSIDEKSKREFLAWLAAVRMIRNNPGLSYREKEQMIIELRSSETSFRTMKAVLNAAIESTPAQNQQIIRTSFAGIGLAASLMKSPHLAIAAMVWSQALPKFLLTPQFEVVASFLEKELEQVLKEIPAKNP